MQRHYELAFLVDSDQATQAHDLAERYSSTITDAGGTVHRLEHWGRRNLAYPIQNRTKAFYVLINLECDAPTRDELQRSLQFNDNILRHLLIRRSEAVTKASQLIAHQHSDAPKDTAEAAPKDTAEAAPKDTAEAAPKDTAEAAPKDTAEAAPKDTAEAAPKDTAEAAPKDTAEAAPKDTAEAAPDQSADSPPEPGADPPEPVSENTKTGNSEPPAPDKV